MVYMGCGITLILMQLLGMHCQSVPPWSPQPSEKGFPPSLEEQANQGIHNCSSFDDPLCIFMPSFYRMAQYRREFYFSVMIHQSGRSPALQL